MKFELGNMVMTYGVSQHIDMKEFTMDDVMLCITRHATGDWGNLCKEDQLENEAALINGERIFSCYELKENRLYVITEWDRSYTTVMLPEEY